MGALIFSESFVEPDINDNAWQFEGMHYITDFTCRSWQLL